MSEFGRLNNERSSTESAMLYVICYSELIFHLYDDMSSKRGVNSFLHSASENAIKMESTFPLAQTCTPLTHGGRGALTIQHLGVI